MRVRPKLVRAGYSLLSGYVVFTGLAIIFEMAGWHFWLWDFAAPIGLTSLFVIVPVAGLCLFLLNRGCREEHTEKQQELMGTARILFVVAWVLSCLPASILIRLDQPWPLSLRHGPDTAYARAGFERLLGFAPPPSVSRIYYRQVGGWLDGGDLLRFDTTSSEVVQRIVDDHDLMKMDQLQEGIPPSPDPGWWKERRGRTELECFFRERSGSFYWYLWYDTKNRTVWYEEFSL